MHMENIEAAEMFGTHHGFTVCTDARYFGGYIGDDETKGDWLKKWTDEMKEKHS